MSKLMSLLDVALPAFMTFGPLFMVMMVRDESRWKAAYKYAGAFMVVGALCALYLGLVTSQLKVERLEGRLQRLEQRLQATDCSVPEP